MALNEKVKADLRLCIAKLFEKSQGLWIGVNEYSFSDLADEFKIERRYVGYLTAVLQDMKLMEVTGIKRWLRYKTLTTWTDLDKILEECDFKHDLWLEEQKDSKKHKGDNKPLYMKEDKIVEINSEPVRDEKPKYHPMESKVWIMKDNKIYEAVVVGITPCANNKGYKHQLQFNPEVKIDPEAPIEYFTFYSLFPNIKALIVSLEKNAIHLKRKH